jgi:cyclopropane-fatty-acyl-phospholipid synthase
MEWLHYEKKIKSLLNTTGIRINGDRPWDIRIHRPEFFKRLLAGGSLSLGESYMDGWWDCDALDQFFDRLLRLRLDQRVEKSARLLWLGAHSALTTTFAGRYRAFEVGKHHYDIGNDLFSIMLDSSMNYSCAYWRNAESLEKAQQQKMELICRKLELAPGMTLLDIGCGWGGLAAYAARRHGVQVLGITVSNEQVQRARDTCSGLPVRIALKDYRNLEGRFDRIVSVGMFEHVGVWHYRTFMRTIRRCLVPNGLFLLHTIGRNHSARACDAWISKYIFPNSMLPSAKQIAASAEGHLVLEDWHSFARDYDRTLMAWYRNFTDHWDQLKHTYGNRFFRMWVYYLLMCAGAFRARRNHLWQIVFSREGVSDDYRSIR